MNLHSIVTGVLNKVVLEKQISLILYLGQSTVLADTTVSYSLPIDTTARVQLESPQTLQHLENINLTNIYKRFYINSLTLSGLNRMIGTGGDYILMDSIKYKIIQVLENFESGYVCVIGCANSKDIV